MSDSVRPHRRQPTRLPRPRDSPGKNTGVGCHFLLQCMKVKNESEVTQSCPTPLVSYKWFFYLQVKLQFLAPIFPQLSISKMHFPTRVRSFLNPALYTLLSPYCILETGKDIPVINKSPLCSQAGLAIYSTKTPDISKKVLSVLSCLQKSALSPSTSKHIVGASLVVQR